MGIIERGGVREELAIEGEVEGRGYRFGEDRELEMVEGEGWGWD